MTEEQKKTLLEKATQNKLKKIQKFTQQDFELVLAYLAGKLTLYRVQKTKELKGTTNTYIYIVKVLRQFADKVVKK